MSDDEQRRPASGELGGDRAPQGWAPADPAAAPSGWSPGEPAGTTWLPMGTGDIIGSPGPRRRSVRRNVLPALVGVVALLVAGTGIGLVSYLSGGGPQPEDVLPDTVFAMAKVDLDPSADQKVAAYKLAKRFPKTSGVSSSDRIGQELLENVFRGSDVDYDRDIKPWVGQRAAVAALPAAKAGDDPEPLLAVAFTDRKTATDALARLAKDDSTVRYAVSTHADYVLIAQDQATADMAARTPHVLADLSTYTKAVDALDGDQIVTAWGDLAAIWRALPEQLRQKGQAAPSGRLVYGAHVTGDGIELVGRGIDVQTGTSTGQVASRPGSGLAGRLPDDAVAVVSGTGLGDGVGSLWASLQGQGDPFGLADTLTAAGIDVPKDAKALLGDETALAVFPDQSFAMTAHGTDVESVRRVLDRLTSAISSVGSSLSGGYTSGGSGSSGDSGDATDGTTVQGASFVTRTAQDGSGYPPDLVQAIPGGVVVGSSPDVVARVAKGDGGLARSPVFKRAVPDADGAALIAFVDVQRAAALAGQAITDPDGQHVEAVGLSVRPGKDGSFRLRITIR